MTEATGKIRETIRKDGVSYVHIAKAAALLGHSKQYVRGLCDAGELGGRLVGGAWYVPEEALAPYLHQKLARNTKRRESIRAESTAVATAVREKARHARRIVGAEIRAL